MFYQILVMCMFQIDPKMDKFFCVDHMIKCTKKTGFDNCSDYWEPLSPVDKELIKEIAITENN